MSNDIIKPTHNRVNGRDAWDLMREIAEGNPAFDKLDAIFLALMFKHIPRAGRKSYDPQNSLQEDKLLDLEKSAVYLNEWIATIKEQLGIDEQPKPKKVVVYVDPKLTSGLVQNPHTEGVVAREMIRSHLFGADEYIPSLTKFKVVKIEHPSSKETLYTVEFEDSYWWVSHEGLSYTILIDDPSLYGRGEE